MKSGKELVAGNQYLYVGKLNELNNRTVVYDEPNNELFSVHDAETNKKYVVMIESLQEIEK